LVILSSGSNSGVLFFVIAKVVLNDVECFIVDFIVFVRLQEFNLVQT
jgi:hypothetical protein